MSTIRVILIAVLVMTGNGFVLNLQLPRSQEVAQEVAVKLALRFPTECIPVGHLSLVFAELSRVNYLPVDKTLGLLTALFHGRHYFNESCLLSEEKSSQYPVKGTNMLKYLDINADGYN